MEISKREEEALIEYFVSKGDKAERYREYPCSSSDFKTIKVVKYKIDRTGTALMVEFAGESKNGDWDEQVKVRFPLVDFILFCSKYNKE